MASNPRVGLARAAAVAAVALALAGVPRGWAQEVHTATRLRVEYQENPLGIDVSAPRFSWANVHPQRGAVQVRRFA